MRGSKTKTAGTAFKQKADLVKEKRILAGTQPLKAIFKNTAAYHIGYGDGTNKGKTPPPAFFTIINSDKNKQKKIQRSPENRITEIGQHSIKKRVRPFAV